MRALLQLALCMQLLLPLAVHAQPILKDPLNYPLRQYALILGLAMLGGFVSWYAKVRKGQINAWSVGNLIGEMTTSAFAGLLAFYGCEYLNFAPLLTAAVAGVAGHMGTRGITWAETVLQRRFERQITGDQQP